MTFKDAFCEHFNCPLERFDEIALWHCFYPHARPLMRLLFRCNPRYLEADLRIIRALGKTTSLGEIRAEVSCLSDNYRAFRFRHIGYAAASLAGGQFTWPKSCSPEVSKRLEEGPHTAQTVG